MGSAGAITPVRKLAQWFDTSSGRSPFAPVQNANAKYADPYREATDTAAHLGEYDVRDLLGQALDGAPVGAEAEALRLLLQHAEEIPGLDAATWQADLHKRAGRKLAPGVADANAVATHLAPHWSKFEEAGKILRGQMKGYEDDAARWGFARAGLDDDEAAYMFRRSIKEASGVPGARIGQPALNAAGPHRMKRKPWLSDIPGGTAFLNTVTIDPAFVGPAAKAVDRKVRRAALVQRMLDHLGDYGLAGRVTPKMLGSLEGKAKELVGWLEKLDPEHVARGVGVFNPDTPAMALLRGRFAGKAGGAVRTGIGGLADNARPIGSFAPHDEAIGLWDALGKLG